MATSQRPLCAMMLAGTVVLLAGMAAGAPPTRCQQQLDAFCAADVSCVSAMKARHAELPLHARNDTDESHGPPAWRCYSPSSLTPDLAHYSNGTDCKSTPAHCPSPAPRHCTRPQLADIVAACETNRTMVDVFTPGELGYPCIRIPAILLLGDNKTLAAFAECRNWTGDGCEPHHLTLTQPLSSNKDVCMKLSTDQGRTWGPLQVVVRNAGQPTPVWDAVRQQLVLQYVQLTPGDNMQMVSKDLGVSWSKPVSLLPFLGTKVVVSQVGPGVGLQLRSPPHAGRMLFIGHHGAYEYDNVWFSDDGGQTFTVSNTSFAHMDEAQLVELPNGHVLANMRNDHYNTSCNCRGLALSTDGGANFGPVFYDPTLISPICMATILTGTNGNIYFANPATTNSRTNGVLRRSSDGLTWDPQTLTIWPGDYAYSCLTNTPNGRIGLLWETGMEQGCTGASCRSVYSDFDF